MSKKGRQLTSLGPTRGPLGMKFDPTESAFTVSLETLPAAEHFFYATNFLSAIQNGHFHLIVGFRSAVEQAGTFRLAIELVMPLKAAKKCLATSIWSSMSSNGRATFIESVKAEIVSNSAIYSNSSATDRETYQLPSDANSFRSFPANIATSSISHGQVMIEFFDAPPDMVVNMLHRSVVRANAQVRSVVGVILSPPLAMELFKQTKQVFDHLRIEEDV